MMRCPNCSSEMLPLFTSVYCPNSDHAGLCDSIALILANGRWLFRRLRSGDAVPKWASRGWSLRRGADASHEDANLSDRELLESMAKRWRDSNAPGWPIVYRDITPGGQAAPAYFEGGCELAVFGRSP